jgi:hypothetical protein
MMQKNRTSFDLGKLRPISTSEIDAPNLFNVEAAPTEPTDTAKMVVEQLRIAVT